MRIVEAAGGWTDDKVQPKGVCAGVCKVMGTGEDGEKQRGKYRGGSALVSSSLGLVS